MKEHLERLTTELKRYGITPALVSTGGGHVRFSWQAEGGAPRNLFVASSISDWRGTLNMVAMIRRWCREDKLIPIDEQTPLVQRVRTHKQGKLSLTPVLQVIEQLQKQISELFEYVTTAEAVTEEPKQVGRKRVPSTDLLQYLNETDWTPATKLAIKWARPYASVQSALNWLESKGLAVNYKGVGWKRTPAQAVQIKVKPVVVIASPPVQPAKPVQAQPRKYADSSWLKYLDFIKWTTAKQLAARAKITREHAREIVRALELEGWLEHSEKHGWRRLYKRRQQTEARPAWGGVTYGVPSEQLLERMSYAEFESVPVLAEKWGRPRDKTTYALAELRKRDLVQNDPRVGWRRVSKPAPKVNGKHHPQERRH